jgi:hypothetical protein
MPGLSKALPGGAQLDSKVSGHRGRDRLGEMPPSLSRRRAVSGAPDGTTSFAVLRGHGDAPAELMYFAFDLLHLDGEDLMRLPLLERKARLETLLIDAPPVIRFSGHIVGNGARVFEEVAKLGVEGTPNRAEASITFQA